MMIRPDSRDLDGKIVGAVTHKLTGDVDGRPLAAERHAESPALFLRPRRTEEDTDYDDE